MPFSAPTDRLAPLKGRSGLVLLGLTLAGIAVNLLSLTPFFGVKLQLGSIVGVFAILRFGRWGLIAGVVVTIAGAQARGVPLGALILVPELLWLQLFLERFNAGRRNADNGRILLADLGFWVVAGIPMAFLLFGLLGGVEASSLGTIVLSASVNSVINTAIGFSLFLVAKHWFPRQMGVKGVSIRGITMAAILLAIAIPSLLLTSLLSRNLEASIQRSQLERMAQLSWRVASLPLDELPALSRSLPSGAQRVDVQRRDADGRGFSTSPELFEHLAQSHALTHLERGQLAELRLLVPKREGPLLPRLLQSHWHYEKKIFRSNPLRPDLTIQVVEPARITIQQLQQQSGQAAGLLAWVILLGALLSEWLGRSFDGQFSRVMAPIFRHHSLISTRGRGAVRGYAMPPLATSFIRELNGMVKLINNRIARVNRLTQSLEQSNHALEASKRELEQLSTTDPLTGCFNRRELNRRLEEEIRRANRLEGDLAYLTFDIDHFKAVNDNYGHPMGDAVLIQIAEVVRSRLRATDCFCRSGGEEFTILLPHCPPAAAQGYAELLRLSVASVEVSHQGQSVQVTISIGLTLFRPGEDTVEQLMARGDEALYAAKEGGRNRVVTH